MTSYDIIQEHFDEDGQLPAEKLGEVTETLISRLKLSGREVTGAHQYQATEGHNAYAIQTLFREIIALKGEVLTLSVQLAKLLGAEEDLDFDYDPEDDFNGMMQALTFDRIRRLYDAVMT